MAKARCVLLGCFDPDLTKLDRYAPTATTTAFWCLMQIYSTGLLDPRGRWRLVTGDVKTAFLQGGRAEGDRDVYVEPTTGVASILGIKPSQFMKPEGAVYGLVVAPRRWHFRVQKDMCGQG